MRFDEYIILKKLSENVTLSVNSLYQIVKKMEVSERTLRRRIRTLQEKGLITILGENPMILELNRLREEEIKEFVIKNEVRYK